MKTYTFYSTISIGDEDDVEVEVEYTFSPGSPGRMYMPNGDPGYPPEPDEVEVVSVIRDDTGANIISLLDDKTLDQLNDAAYESSADIDDDYDW